MNHKSKSCWISLQQLPVSGVLNFWYAWHNFSGILPLHHIHLYSMVVIFILCSYSNILNSSAWMNERLFISIQTDLCEHTGVKRVMPHERTIVYWICLHNVSAWKHPRTHAEVFPVYSWWECVTIHHQMVQFNTISYRHRLSRIYHVYHPSSL